MIRRGAIGALVTAAVLLFGLLVAPWLFVVHVWARVRNGVA